MEGLEWVVSAYAITFAALILTAGALGDRIGAERVFVVFTIASAACRPAPSLREWSRCGPYVRGWVTDTLRLETY